MDRYWWTRSSLLHFWIFVLTTGLISSSFILGMFRDDLLGPKLPPEIKEPACKPAPSVSVALEVPVPLEQKAVREKPQEVVESRQEIIAAPQVEQQLLDTPQERPVFEDVYFEKMREWERGEKFRLSLIKRMKRGDNYPSPDPSPEDYAKEEVRQRQNEIPDRVAVEVERQRIEAIAEKKRQRKLKLERERNGSVLQQGVHETVRSSDEGSK